MVAVKKWKRCVCVTTARPTASITLTASQFQYIALIRYCQNTHAARKPLQKSLTDAEKKVASMQELASAEHVKVLSLQQEIEQLRAQKAQTEAVTVELQRLQGLEQEIEHYRRLDVTPRDLETFVSNKAAIRHYLKLVPMLLEYVTLCSPHEMRNANIL